MQHYYNAFSNDLNEAKAKQEYTNKEILPFSQYLTTSINALKQKEIKARWEEVEVDINATINLDGYLYEYNPTSKIQLDFELLDSILFIENIPNDRDYDENLILKMKDDKKEKLKIKEGDIFESKDAIYRLGISKSDDNTTQEPIESTKQSQGFIKLDKSININNIDKISWAGENLDFKSFKEWLCNGDIELDSKTIKIKEYRDNSLIIESHKKDAKTISKQGFILPATLQSNAITQKYEVVQNNENMQIIYTQTKIKNYNEIPKKDAQKYYDLQTLTHNGKKIELELRDSNKVFIKNLKQDELKLTDKNKLQYTIKKLETHKSIKLLPFEEGAEEEIESPLRYFLDPEIEVKAIIDEHGKKTTEKCKVKIINRDEFIITLLYKGRAIVPIKDSILQTQPNPYPLKCQQNAINMLINYPIYTQHALLKLFGSRKNDNISWDTTESSIDIKNWYVLTDSKRKGADIQRSFVQKALATDDFAILEGPPGSGKTTVILELISQIIAQGKRVLLCGSTHVAIDNVLERLKDKKLIDTLNILPIRVGSEGALSDEVQEFRLGDLKRNYKDSLLEKYSIYDDLDSKEEQKGKIGLKFFMQCANLVCGTTIGILQYPAFKLKDENDEKNKKNSKIKKPIIPDFDYLIIDECSKTTFQEFLVPAMYAKKWIIVGDTRQLSPFVDKEELEENIKNLPLNFNRAKNKFDFLESNYQEACFLLFKMAEIYKKNNSKLKLAMGVSKDILDIIEKEIEIRTEEKRDNFGVLNDRLEVGYIKDANTSYFANLTKDWIFYDETLMKSDTLHNPLARIIPADFFDCNNIASLFQYSALKESQNKTFNLNRKDNVSLIQFIDNINKELKERSFAGEIAWRLNREFEKRTFEDSKDSKKQNYTKVIDELLPKSHEQRDLIRKKLSTIANIALPSILESLIKGVSDRRSERMDSTIRSGFRKNELESRHSILHAQGRMHQDISKFPREQFYKDSQALQDLENLQRDWGYTRYEKRSVWIDIKGNSFRGKNEEEAKKLIEELKAFIDYATYNDHPLNEEWSIAVLSFYKGQTRILEEKLQNFTGLKHKTTNFTRKYNNKTIHIKLCSVDKFQGQEADIVFLSMVNTNKIGFLDSPNRLNVGITRAKFQLVILGNYDYFSTCKEPMLEAFAKAQYKDKRYNK